MTSPSPSINSFVDEEASERYDLEFYQNNYNEYEQGNVEPILKGRLSRLVESIFVLLGNVGSFRIFIRYK